MRHCKECQVVLGKRHQIDFCSNKCQNNLRFKDYIDKWKRGLVDGNKGINTRNISGYIKKYLLVKFGTKCSQCGWSKLHPIRNVVPLEIDHIDGDAENNSERNLRLLCPNCHSLTPYFRNMNKGKGRKWRKDKYIKN